MSRYDDIIGLPHHVSARHRQMSMEERAAQFSPFAALTGFEDSIRETGRLTERRAELTDERREELDQKLQLLSERIDERPEAVITWFRPDERKEGGAYVETRGRVRKIDPYRMVLRMEDGTEIPLEDIYQI